MNIYIYIHTYIYIYIYISVEPSVAKLVRNWSPSTAAPSGTRCKKVKIFIDGLYTTGTRAHTHRELIHAWLWEPKGSSFEYI